MKNDDSLLLAFTGSQISVLLLKGQLAEAGIDAIIQNDYQSGITAGFGGGTPSSIELFIRASDQEKARPILNQFREPEK